MIENFCLPEIKNFKWKLPHKTCDIVNLQLYSLS